MPPRPARSASCKVKIGDRVSQGDLIVLLEAEGGGRHPAQGEGDGGRRPVDGRGQASYGSPAGAYETIEVKVPESATSRTCR